MPPNFAFQLYNVASEIPCLRARSPAFAPASCSRRTAMICSSVNRFLFIVRLPLSGRTLNLSGGNLQWQVSFAVDFKAAHLLGVAMHHSWIVTDLFLSSDNPLILSW